MPLVLSFQSSNTHVHCMPMHSLNPPYADWTRLATDKSQFNKEIIDACISGAINYGREVVMLQAGASYFAYQPVLQALKNAPIPFDQYITKFVDRKTRLDWKPSLPAYMIESEQGSKFSLLGILSPSDANAPPERRYSFCSSRLLSNVFNISCT